MAPTARDFAKRPGSVDKLSAPPEGLRFDERVHDLAGE